MCTARTACVALSVCILAVLPVLAADWPNWRGPNHDGISPEKGFATTWTDAPKTIWDKPIGAAFSSFTCVGDKVYTCGTKNKIGRASCRERVLRLV